MVVDRQEHSSSRIQLTYVCHFSHNSIYGENEFPAVPDMHYLSSAQPALYYWVFLLGAGHVLQKTWKQMDSAKEAPH